MRKATVENLLGLGMAVVLATCVIWAKSPPRPARPFESDFDTFVPEEMFIPPIEDVGSDGIGAESELFDPFGKPTLSALEVRLDSSLYLFRAEDILLKPTHQATLPDSNWIGDLPTIDELGLKPVWRAVGRYLLPAYKRRFKFGGHCRGPDEDLPPKVSEDYYTR